MQNQLKSSVVAVCVTLCVLTAQIPTFAHHGANIYDLSKTVVLKGTVTEFKFSNPHVQVYFDVKDESGNVVNWNAEGNGVYFWSKVGWNKNSLKSGDQITVTLHPSKSGSPVGVVIKMVAAGGKEIVTELAGESVK